MKKSSPPRAILFLAVSTEAQAAEDRESLAEQERALTAAAEREGWRIVDTLRIPGHSRRFYTYAEFCTAAEAQGITDPARMWDHWRKRDFDVLAAVTFSRLGREQSIMAEVVGRTVDAGARLYAVQGGWIDSGNMRPMSAFAGMSSAMEVDELRRRHEYGMRGRVRKGLPAGLVPATHLLLRDFAGRAERLIVDESKRRLFDDIFDLLCHERVIIRGMEAHLEARGHARLGDRVVDSWLRNPYTWGHSARRFVTAAQRGNWRWVYDPAVMVPDGVELWRDTHEAVWTGAQAAAMWAELDRRQATYGGHYLPYRSYRYSGLCRCAHCGAAVSYRVNRDRYRYLRCNRTCTPGNLREAVVDTFIRGLMDSIMAGASMADMTGEEPDTSAERRRRIDAEIGQVTAQAAALIRKQASAPATLWSLYDAELTALAARLDALQRERARILPPAAASATQASEDDLRARGVAWFWAAPEITQNAILHSLFGRWRLSITSRDIVAMVWSGNP